MNSSLSRLLSAAAGLVLAAVLVGCGGAEPDAAAEPTPDGAEEVVDDAPVEAEPADADPGSDQVEAQADPTADTSEQVDLDVPPGPDPDGRAEDYPDFEWAFERGRQAGLYGREDFYEPHSVSEPGSMAGLAAGEAYRGGFALGLAEQAAKQEEREAEEAAAEAERLANYPVGEVIEGWDPRSAVSAFWELGEAESCDTAGAADPCLDTWYTFGNAEVIALARLDPAAGPEPDSALMMTGHVMGYEVQEAWTAADEPSVPLPEWAQRTG